MQKVFRVYPGVLLVDFVLFFFFAIAFINFSFLLDNLLFLSVVILLFIGFVIVFIQHTTYKVVLKDQTLIEKGVFTKNKTISVQSIKKIQRSFYSFFTYQKVTTDRFFTFKALLFWLTKFKINPFSGITMISFTTDFPSIPVSKKIIAAVYQVNPHINFSKDIVDFVPKYIRKKAGIDVTAIDIIATTIWRFCLIVLSLLVFVFVLFLIVSLLGL